jgi:2-dehydro-3-deoxygluconokinase
VSGVTDFVTLGETMAVLASPEIGPLRAMSSLRLSMAGSESNVAIGLRRLGHEAAWIGRVGNDEFGKLIVERLRAERVDVRAVRVDDGAATAIMLKERRSADLARVTYYRGGHAGSRLEVGDLDESLIAGARVLHVTGITPALSGSARAATHRAVEIARAAGIVVSLDVNYRQALWSRAEASEELRPLAAEADLIFAGTDELELLDGRPDAAEAARTVASRNGCEVVVKLGSRGAFAVANGATYEEQARDVRLIDPVGAGDAFVAGYLSAQLDGLGIQERLARGAATSAFAVTVSGDWEGLPTRDELELLELAEGDTLR